MMVIANAGTILSIFLINKLILLKLWHWLG